MWWDASCKELKNVCIAFEEFEGDKEDILTGYQFVKCHMIFDIKMGEGFIREAPALLTYSSVVSRYSVRIALAIADFNALKVLACNIQNAFLTAKYREK